MDSDLEILLPDLYYAHKWDEKPVLSDYLIHTHEIYEVLVFIKGDASFVVEGSERPLAPMDILVTRPGEMHQIFHHSRTGYERVLFHLTDNFFAKNNCMRYRDIFTERETGTGNIISGQSVAASAVPELLQRVREYAGEQQADNQTVIRCATVEFLHAISRLAAGKTSGMAQSEAVRKATAYINRNLAGDLSLEELSERFFVSKYHLCRIFKKYTGMTMGQYITQKRILLAKKLRQNGHSLSEAAALSGFSDYSAFYKACLKETGKPPKDGLR